MTTLCSFLSSLSIYEAISDCNREEKAAPSILDLYSRKWPRSEADDMASSKMKCNIGSFYNKEDKLSCHERLILSIMFSFQRLNFIHY